MREPQWSRSFCRSQQVLCLHVVSYCIYLQQGSVRTLPHGEEMDELTPRQAQILQLIREHVSSRGYPPTRAEICRIMGFRSPNAAEEHLKALARKGAIEMAPGASRGLRLKAAAPGIPLVGRVAAGSPILAESH